jgi:hypothetical protein
MQTAQREVQTFSPVRMIHFCELTSLLSTYGTLPLLPGE